MANSKRREAESYIDFKNNKAYGGVVLLGAGGHSKVVADCWRGRVDGYVTGAAPPGVRVIIAFGGVTPAQLVRRQEVFGELPRARYVNAIHPSAIISPSATLGVGVMVGPGAVINASAVIGDNVIINSRAVVEHDASVGAGSHIAPGAIILGSAKIGSCCMVGAGAVVLPGHFVPGVSLVKALSRVPR